MYIKALPARYRAIVGVLLLCMAPILLHAQNGAADYIEQHKRTAIILMKQTGIPASVILGVSMVESALGKSRNCRMLNNYFGIKGKNTLSKTKPGFRSAYKQYPNPLASFRDFVRIIQRKKFYPDLKGSKDYKHWLREMNRSGYASAKHAWVNDISFMIRKYNLTDFDDDELIVDDDSYPIWGADSTLIQLQE